MDDVSFNPTPTPPQPPLGLRHCLFAVYDSKAETYNPPFTMRTPAEAMRAFTHAATDKETAMGQHPEDFSLFFLGYYDLSTAEVELLEAKTSLGTLSDLAR